MLCLAMFLAAPGTAQAGQIYRVKADAASGGDGTTWNNACVSLAEVLASVDVVSGDQIWVAAGTYKPEFNSSYATPAGNVLRTKTFALKAGVAIYGGFAGTESSREDRNLATNETILTGDLNGDDITGDLTSPDILSSREDNSFHVVYSNGMDKSAVLDGFTITGGNADGDTADNRRGGGMYNNQSSPTVRNCTFSQNNATSQSGITGGGGMYNYFASSPTVTNCTFSQNRATGNNCHGGGMYNHHLSNPTVIGCTFSGNIVTGNSKGGGMYNGDSSKPEVTHCTFSQNRAHSGGGMYNDNSTPKVRNCTFSQNVAHGEGISSGGGGGMSNYISSSTVMNCRFSGNSAEYNGGGMSNNGSNPTVTNCTFSQNSITTDTGGRGGGMYNEKSSPTVTNCAFSGNISDNPNGTGGGMGNKGSSPTVTNCTFSGNVADHSGGGMDNNASSPTVTNCTFSENNITANVNGKSGGMFNCVGSSPTVTNCIFWNDANDEICNYNSNPDVSYCVVQNNEVGTGTVSSDIIPDDPCLGDLANNGCLIMCGAEGTQVTLQTCALEAGSFAIDAGTSTVMSGDINLVPLKDPRGVVRPPGSVDIGAYEVGIISQQHTLTMKTNGTGTVSPDVGTHTYADGSAVELTATPAANSIFTGWSGALSGSASSATVTMDCDKTVTATFALKPSSVAVASSDMRDDPDAAIMDALATVTDGGTIVFPDELAGETFVFSDDIQINQNVRLVAPDGGVALSGGGNHRVLHVEASGDVTLQGFTLCSGDAGSENGGGIYNKGRLALTNCTVAENEAAAGGGIWNGTTGTLTLSSSTVSANSSGISNEGTLRVKSSIVAANEGTDIENGGTIVSSGFNLAGTGSTDLFAASGDIVSVEVTAADLFAGPLGCFGSGVPVLALKAGAQALDGGSSTDISGSVVSDDQRGKSRPQGSGYDIGAYEAEWFTVAVSADIGGTFSAEPYGIIVGSADFTAFDTPTFVITPEESMDLTGVRLDSDDQSVDVTGATVTLDPLSGDHLLEATFAVKTFNITGTVSGDVNGSVTATPASVDWGCSSTVTISADAGYHIVSVTDHGSSVDFGTSTKDFSFTLDNVRENHEITASFAAIDNLSLTVTTDGTGTGTVTPSGGTYPNGTKVTLTATPADSSNFTGWSGVDTSNGTSATVTMTGDKSVTATFALKTFTITATAGKGGSVDPETALVEWGDSHTVTITPAEKSSISQIFVDGVSVGAAGSYTFPNVHAPHRLQAFFMIDQGTQDPGGTVDIVLDQDDAGALNEVLDGNASLDLPPEIASGAVSFDVESPVNLGCLLMGKVEFGDVEQEVASVEPEGKFLTGVSFDIVASSDNENVGLLPVNLQLVVSEELLSTGCLAAIDADEENLGLAETFLSHVSILKVVSGDIYDLYDVAFSAGLEPLDFFTLSRNESGSFLVGFGFLVADTSAEGVAAIQTVPAEGDNRFLIFDGAKDNHYRDPVIAVEKSSVGDDATGGGGCSTGALLPGVALLLVPLMLLKTRR